MDELLDNGKTMQVEHQKRVVKKSGEFPAGSNVEHGDLIFCSRVYGFIQTSN